MSFESIQTSQPRVEIILTTYNRAHIVTQAINSVLAQNYQNLQLIVVDDGSTDHTLEVLRSYATESRFRLLTLPSNRGVTGAKNAGLDALSQDTEYFGIFDSDDIMTPNTITTLVQVMQSGDYSQAMGLCRNLQDGVTISLYDEQPCTKPATLSFQEALAGRISGEYWQIANARIVGDLRFDVRALGGENIFWNELLRQKPAAITDHIVREYNDSGEDRVSLGAYSRKKATGKMWVYRAYLDRFKHDLTPERRRAYQQEAIKYAMLGGDYAYAFSHWPWKGASFTQHLKLLLWPIYALWRSRGK